MIETTADTTTATTSDSLHIWSQLNTADEAQAWVESHLQASRDRIAELTAPGAARSTVETLALYDQAAWHLRMAGSQAHVMFMVHPLAPVRDAGQALSQVVAAEGVQLSLNRDVYKALEALDAGNEDPATKYYLERTLLGYRLAGVDRDDATREKIRELADKSTELGMRFARTVQDDVRKIEVTDPNELRGLPPDFLERFGVREQNGQLTHHANPDAPIILTTDPPVLAPVMTYAASPALRRRMYLAYNDRGYPINAPVLLDLLKVREEMAEVLGFRSWADLATVDQMMGSAANMRKFLTEVEHAARETAQREFAELEAFVRSRDPKALPLTLSDARFWEEQYRRSYYDFDSQSVRPFFPYEQVEAGILAIAGKLFGVRFERNTSASVWHTDVKAFDVF
jgi:thimet oligopeptidase